MRLRVSISAHLVCTLFGTSKTSEVTARASEQERERASRTPKMYIPDSIDPAGLIRVKTPYSIFYCVILYLIFYAQARARGEVIVFQPEIFSVPMAASDTGPQRLVRSFMLATKANRCAHNGNLYL